MRHLILLNVSLMMLCGVHVSQRDSLAASHPSPSFSQETTDSCNGECVPERKKKKSKAKKSTKRKNTRRKAARRKTAQNRQRQPRNNTAQKTSGARPGIAANRRPAVNSSRKKPASTRPESKTDDKAEAVRVKVLTWKQTLELVEKHKGKVVVIDIWSTWCEPCLKEFPNLVRLQKDHPDTLACMSFNVDNDGSKDSTPALIRGRILKFLTKQNARFENVIAKESDETVYKQAKIDSPPTILVFGKDGKLAKRFDVNSSGGKEPTYEKHVIPFVTQLLAK